MFLLKRNSIYYVEYLDIEENRIRRVSTNQRIKRDAIKFLTDFENNLKTKKSFKHIFLDEYEKQYSEYIKTNLSTKYYTTVKLSFRQLTQFTGNIPLSKLSYPLLDKFFTETHIRTQQGAWTYYRILKSAFNKAIKWGYLSGNVFNQIKLPSIPRNNPLFINEIELNQILKNVNNPTLVDLYTFAFHTGIRLGEIINLTWDHVSLSEKLIRVANTKEFMIKGKKERVIPINEKLFKLLSNKLTKYYTLQEPEYVFNKNGFRFKTIFQKVLRKQ